MRAAGAATGRSNRERLLCARACATRTAGLLFRAWPGVWQLYLTSEHQEVPTEALDSPPILTSEERPTREQEVEALNAALRTAKQQQQKSGWW